jgi:hypothetical protein
VNQTSDSQPSSSTDTGSTNEPSKNWVIADLDRCEHGRHSIDTCFSCPGGWSSGNLYLSRIAVLEDHDYGPGERVRIGTTLGADPIYVIPVRQRRFEYPPGPYTPVQVQP